MKEIYVGTKKIKDRLFKISYNQQDNHVWFSKINKPTNFISLIKNNELNFDWQKTTNLSLNSYEIDFFFSGLPLLAFSIGVVTPRSARFNKQVGQYHTAQSGGHWIPTQTL